MFFSAEKVVWGGMLNYSCRKHPKFVYVIVFFLLKGGKFPQNVLLSAKMLNMLNHVGSKLPKKSLLSVEYVEYVEYVECFLPRGPHLCFQRGSPDFFGYVEFFLQKERFLFYVELFLQKAAFFLHVEFFC